MILLYCWNWWYLSVSFPFPCTTKLPAQSTNSFKPKVSCPRRQDAEETCWDRLLHLCCSLRPPWVWSWYGEKLRVGFEWHLNLLCFLTSARWKISYTLQWCLPISILSEILNQVPFERRGGGRAVWGCKCMCQKNFPMWQGFPFQGSCKL